MDNNKLRIIGALLLVLGITRKSSADYYYDSYNGYKTNQGYSTGYENGYSNYQQYYPQQTNQYNYNQQRPTARLGNTEYSNYQQYYPQQNGQNYNQPQTASVSVTEAEWVCTNSKTNDMMVIVSEDGPAPRGAQQVEWQQVYPQQQQQQQQQQQTHQSQNQPSYPYPQEAQVTSPQQPQPQQTYYPQNNQPNHQEDYYPTVGPIYTTTERSGPVWGVVGKDNDNELSAATSQTNQNYYPTSAKPTTEPLWPTNDNDNRPGFTLVTPTPKPHTTTEDPSDRPVWSDVEPPKKPQQTTQAPAHVKPVWPTVETTKKPQQSTQAPAVNKPNIWPEMEPPEKPSGQASPDPDDDDSTIQIVMGKK